VRLHGAFYLKGFRLFVQSGSLSVVLLSVPFAGWILAYHGGEARFSPVGQA
jgi:hypothetical protein